MKLLNTSLRRALPVIALLALFPLTGCNSREKDGWFERQGERIDDAKDDVGDAIEDAGDEIEDEL